MAVIQLDLTMRYDAIMKHIRFVMVALAVLLAASLTHAGTDPIVTTDLLRMRWVTAIDVAKDGQRVVYSVRSIATMPSDPAPVSPDSTNQNSEPIYKYQSHLFLLELSAVNAVPRQLTFGERSDSAPTLSPDGKRIAFVRESAIKQAQPQSGRPVRESESNAQVWVMSIDGGEARQVTNFKTGCSNPVWSPDGSRLLVSSSLKLNDIEGTPPWPSERPKRQWKDAAAREADTPRPDGSREQIRAWLERNGATLNPNVINRLEFQDETELQGTMRFTHLFMIDPDAATLPLELGAARRVTNGFYDHREPAFTPDGKSIVYTSKKPVEQHPDRVLATTLWRINADGSNDMMILAMDGWTLNSPEPSRDGSALAFTGQKLDEPTFRQTQLGLASLTSDGATDPVWLTEDSTFAGSVDNFRWQHGKTGLTFNTAMRGGFPLMTIAPGLVQPAPLVEKIDDEPAGVNVFDIGGGAMVYAVTTVSNPCVLRVRDGFGDRMVDDLNQWVVSKNLSKPVEGWIARPDGTQVQYWIMEPTNREPGKKYPMVVNMHGGPAAMWGPGEFSMWHEFQLMCSWGFGVVYCNPRGSGGYGYEFQKKNFQDWGEGPAGDVLAACDMALLQEWVDRDRLVLTGGSYAGYLTVWIIGNDHRFKAAVSQRGVYDFMTFYGEGNAWRLVAYAMGSNPPPLDARFRQVFDRNNALNFVSRIRTPLLIKHGSNDLRTGVSQSEMLYRALKEAGKPVEYVRYPDVGHELSRSGDPLQRMDRLNRIIEFFERYVANPRPAPVASSVSPN